jgi:hypothetical protein
MNEKRRLIETIRIIDSPSDALLGLYIKNNFVGNLIGITSSVWTTSVIVMCLDDLYNAPVLWQMILREDYVFVFQS